VSKKRVEEDDLGEVGRTRSHRGCIVDHNEEFLFLSNCSKKPLEGLSRDRNEMTYVFSHPATMWSLWGHKE
jgi:hypothetical protein